MMSSGSSATAAILAVIAIVVVMKNKKSTTTVVPDAVTCADAVKAACGTIRGSAREACIKKTKAANSSCVAAKASGGSSGSSGSSGAVGPMPTVPWASYAQTTVIGTKLKTMGADLNLCKAACHANPKCTHFEVLSTSPQSCILKSMDLPMGCMTLKERCSDGQKMNVVALYPHPDRAAATGNYALNIYNTIQKKLEGCNWKCKLLKAVDIILTIIGAVSMFFTGPLGLAAGVAAMGAQTGLSMGVTRPLNAKRAELLAKGEPYDTALIQGIPFSFPRTYHNCGMTDACDRGVSMLEARGYMDDIKKVTKASDVAKMSVADRSKYRTAIDTNNSWMQKYQSLPCGENCAEQDIAFKQWSPNYTNLFKFANIY